MVPGGPKEPQEASRKGSDSEKGCESKGRCGLCLRKGKKIRKMNQSKGVLVALRNPRGPMGPKNGPYSVPGVPREAIRTKQGLIGVLKKRRNKDKRGALPRPQDSQLKGPDGVP
jgi:hypothetical protein